MVGSGCDFALCREVAQLLLMLDAVLIVTCRCNIDATEPAVYIVRVQRPFRRCLLILTFRLMFRPPGSTPGQGLGHQPCCAVLRPGSNAGSSDRMKSAALCQPRPCKYFCSRCMRSKRRSGAWVPKSRFIFFEKPWEPKSAPPKRIRRNFPRGATPHTG